MFSPSEPLVLLDSGMELKTVSTSTGFANGFGMANGIGSAGLGSVTFLFFFLLDEPSQCQHVKVAACIKVQVQMRVAFVLLHLMVIGSRDPNPNSDPTPTSMFVGHVPFVITIFNLAPSCDFG